MSLSSFLTGSFCREDMTASPSLMNYNHIERRAVDREKQVLDLREFMEDDARKETKWKASIPPQPPVHDVGAELQPMSETPPTEFAPIGLPTTWSSHQRVSRICYAPDKRYSTQAWQQPPGFKMVTLRS